MTDLSSQALRADARENRDRVLESARELFARSGLGVTMRQIARHAEVGPATLYRRFPTKEALTLEAFLDELEACRGIMRDAAADPDPWRGFCSVIERISVLNAQNQGFTDAFLAAFPSAVDFAAHRTEMLTALAAIARRAKAAGRLRADFVVDDFVLVLLAGRGLATTAVGDRTAAARRFAALAVDGFRAADSNGPLPPRAHVAASAMRV